jgi:hypothetical protein
MFHLGCWYQSVDPASAYVQLAAPADPSLNVTTPYIQVPALNQIIWVAGGAENTVAPRMRLVSPSILMKARNHITPLSVAAAGPVVPTSPHAVMDLSTGGDLDAIRSTLLKTLHVPFGTVPIYQAGIDAIEKHGSIVEMTEDDMFNTFEHQAKQGVDFAVERWRPCWLCPPSSSVRSSGNGYAQAWSRHARMANACAG